MSDLIESNKLEPTLQINQYNKLEVKKLRDTVIINIMNLLIGDVKYFSTSEDPFINIKKYHFKDIDSNLSLIQDEINQKINKFIPNSQIQEILVKKVDSNILAIGIEFTPNSNEDTNNIFILKITNTNDINKLTIELLDQ